MVCRKKRTVFLVLLIVFVFSVTTVYPQPPKVYTPVSREHSWKEVAFDFSFWYAFLWASFLVGQHYHVKNLSWERFYKNTFEIGAVGYDKNSFTTNFIGHPLAGSEYYLYFRARGYAPEWAMLSTLLVSTMFEGLVESFNEPFSGIDFVVTPLLGVPVGVLREKWGLRLVNSGNKYNRFIGHILYLETNFWFFENVEINPSIDIETGFKGFVLRAEF